MSPNPAMNPPRDSSFRYPLNPAVQGLGHSATLAINERCRRMLADGREVIRLGLGQSPFPVPEVVVDELRRQAHQKAYLPVQGLPELRDAVAAYLDRTEDLSYSPEQVLIGPGTKELMFLLQFVCEAELLQPSPSWVSYAPQAGITGRPVRWLPIAADTDVGLDPNALDDLCAGESQRMRLLVLNYPNNPTGSTYTAEQLEAIARVARKHQLLVLSDEIYSGLHFEGEHVSIARFYPEGTIICNGLSKWCGAGGWRLGPFIFPPELNWLLDAMTVLATETFTSVSAPVQYAAVQALQGGAAMDAYLARIRRILKALMNYAWQELRNVGASASQPRGGFYLFPNMDKLRTRLGVENGADLCRQLLADTGVAVLPGGDFGRPALELSMRIACVDFDGAAAMQAIAAVPGSSPLDEAFLLEYCQPTVDGIDRLCHWLSQRR